MLFSRSRLGYEVPKRLCYVVNIVKEQRFVRIWLRYQDCQQEVVIYAIYLILLLILKSFSSLMIESL